jgi:hypothetical protein
VKFSHIISAVALIAIASGCGNSTRSTGPTDLTDTTPPPAVTGISMLVNGRTHDITVFWEPSTAPDVASYEVYAADDGGYALIGSTPATRMDLAATAAPTTYAVRAIDTSGNASPFALYTPGDESL